MQLLHHLGPLVEEGLLALLAGEVAGDEVLPHQQTQLVGVVVPARGLDLDVLADRVEAEVLLRLQVEDQGVVAGRRVQTVGVEALVELGEEKNGFPLSTSFW